MNVGNLHVAYVRCQVPRCLRLLSRLPMSVGGRSRPISSLARRGAATLIVTTTTTTTTTAAIISPSSIMMTTGRVIPPAGRACAGAF